MIKQKFKTGQRVKTVEKLTTPRFLECCGNCIVQYSHAELCELLNSEIQGDVEKYSLLLLDEKDNVIEEAAWYQSSLLTIIDSDILSGLKIIENHHSK